MKYQNLASFEKHLTEAFPAHLSRVYMVLCPDGAERKQIVDKTAALLTQKEGEKRLFKIDDEGASLKELIELLQTKPLFASHWVVVLEGVELLKKAEVETLFSYLEKPSSFAFLILSGSALQPQANFYQRAKKELILLDMGGEKPWEKKKRLKEWLVEQAAKEKKALPDEVALFLLDQVGSEKSALEQELFKLITFVGDKKTVSLADALAITSKTQTLTNWKFAELLVWEEKNQAFPNIEDTSDLLGLIASLRAQFEQGLKAVSSGEVDQEIPSWKKEQLDKQRTLAQKRGADFFAKALVLLFEIELEAKNSLFSPKLLADFLLCKITALKYGTSTSSKLAS